MPGLVGGDDLKECSPYLKGVSSTHLGASDCCRLLYRKLLKNTSKLNLVYLKGGKEGSWEQKLKQGKKGRISGDLSLKCI